MNNNISILIVVLIVIIFCGVQLALHTAQKSHSRKIRSPDGGEYRAAGRKAVVRKGAGAARAPARAGAKAPARRQGQGQRQAQPARRGQVEQEVEDDGAEEEEVVDYDEGDEGDEGDDGTVEEEYTYYI